MPKFRLRYIFTQFRSLDELRNRILSWICNYGTTFFDRSYPIIKVVSPAAQKYVDGKELGIFAIYHGRMIGLLQLIQPRRDLTILISNSRDGEIIARGAQGLGFSVARGSPAHGAVSGAFQLINASQHGQHLTLTVDGPRGPIHKVKSGVIRIAQLAQRPIIPSVCSGRKNQNMWGWDSFMATCWGSPIVYLIGDPIMIPAKASEPELENIRQQLDKSMSHLRNLADGYWEATT